MCQKKGGGGGEKWEAMLFAVWGDVMKDIEGMVKLIVRSQNGEKQQQMLLSSIKNILEKLWKG